MASTNLELKDVFAENRPTTGSISSEQLVFAPARGRPSTARISRDDTRARSSSIGLTQASAAEVSGTESYSEVHDIVRKLDELKQLKREMEEKLQSKETDRLRNELDIAHSDKRETIERIKATAKATLDASSKSVQEMGDALKSLKHDHDKAFAFAEQARSSLLDVQELRPTVQESMTQFEALFDGNGDFALHKEIMAPIADLRMEYTQSRQANDLLRDQLTDMSSQLCEERDRVRELEGIRVTDAALLKRSTDNLLHAGDTINKQSESLRNSQSELADALHTCATLETQCKLQEEKLGQLGTLEGQREELTDQTQKLQHKCASLQALVEDKDHRLHLLKKAEDEWATVAAISNERLTEIDHLKAEEQVCRRTIDQMTGTIEQLKTRCTQLDGENTARNQSIVDLRGEFDVVKTRLEAALTAKGQASADLAAREENLKALQHQLDDARAEGGTCREQMQQLQVRMQVLQERYEDQSTTLRLVKETNGDLQERLATSEKQHASILAGEKERFIRVNSDLESKVASLQRSLHEAQNSLKRQQEDLETRLEKERDKHQSQLVDSRAQATHAEQEVIRASVETTKLREQLSSAQIQLADVTRLKEVAEESASTRYAEMESMSTRVESLTRAKVELEARSQTLSERYHSGDLTDTEKSFARIIEEVTETCYKNKILEKQNELKRVQYLGDLLIMGNKISDLESKIAFLEKSLARRLNENKLSEEHDLSVLDIGSVAPELPASQAPDSDGPAENDQPVTFVPSRIQYQAQPSVRTPAQTRPIQARPPPAPMRDAPLARPVNAGPTARPVFSRITAQDEDDDEISDAEDDDDVPFALGKRDRPQKKQESEQDGERSTRRQKPNTRQNGGAGKKDTAPAQAQTPKPKAARRRH
ncbi:uncharacterized protein STEHIDRAFT_138733 [Stereum hirsutum FP-91666 SS1]|uniref:uncharacterized protein n=1 Tax=Stereum hirsutum (strain FP-91666) TaxID=721885 RepID=UPI000440FF28|nr:uncharacterized protein STEHIDRAFT_138733 [Stereum hirsutum FP-91666 SS1]EIM88418.1 hypothetical protein STEHIDRAFT_138733 [Stereum hirsutum FP-91666 SS1]